MGFTSTYNDFDYTGIVFRVQSFSTKEHVRKLPTGTGRNVDLTGETAARNTAFSINSNYHTYSSVWRSMVGFDLLRTISSLVISFSASLVLDQAWFLLGQWLMKNQWDNVANPLCYVVDNAGNGITREAKALSRQDGKRHYSNSQCRVHRWEHLFTLGFANQGLFASRVESRNAVVYEPRAKDWLVFSQWWWRNVLGDGERRIVNRCLLVSSQQPESGLERSLCLLWTATSSGLSLRTTCSNSMTEGSKG